MKFSLLFLTNLPWSDVNNEILSEFAGFSDKHELVGSKIYDGNKKVIRPNIGPGKLPGMMSVLLEEPWQTF